MNGQFDSKNPDNYALIIDMDQEGKLGLHQWVFSCCFEPPDVGLCLLWVADVLVWRVMYSTEKTQSLNLILK